MMSEYAWWFIGALGASAVLTAIIYNPRWVLYLIRDIFDRL